MEAGVPPQKKSAEDDIEWIFINLEGCYDVNRDAAMEPSSLPL